jgi:cysteine synthase B
MTWRAHYETTAPEIFEQTEGTVTHFVAGLGTSGTFVGTGRRLRELKPSVRLVSMEPDGPMHGLEGLKHMETSIVPAIYDTAVADSKIEVSTEEAQAAARTVARGAGLLLGPSGGANLAAAVRLGRDLAEQGREAVIVTVFADAGERYVGERFWTP